VIPAAAKVAAMAAFIVSRGIRVPGGGASSVNIASTVAPMPSGVTTITVGRPLAEAPSRPGSSADIPHALSGQPIRASATTAMAAERRWYQGSCFDGTRWYFS
jgi:hypothetical protein